MTNIGTTEIWAITGNIFISKYGDDDDDQSYLCAVHTQFFSQDSKFLVKKTDIIEISLFSQCLGYKTSIKPKNICEMTYEKSGFFDHFEENSPVGGGVSSKNH